MINPFKKKPLKSVRKCDLMTDNEHRLLRVEGWNERLSRIGKLKRQLFRHGRHK